jgi:CRISPR-associated protein Cas2
MYALIAYEISDNRTRRKFFSFLREKGLHTQKSVFECVLGQKEFAAVLRMAAALDMQPWDSVVIYPLCRRCAHRAIILGQGIRVTQTDWMVI